MQIGNIRTLDQKNRIHIPADLMQLVGIKNNSSVYVSCVPGEDYIRIYSKERFDDGDKHADLRGE